MRVLFVPELYRPDDAHALRSLGYADAGNPGTPVFVRSGRAE
jgi:hypothetical protein